MKLAHTILALFVAVFALPMAAVGQDEEAIDEIVVASKKPTGSLRRDLNRAEDDFYSLYNKLNDDNLYDVRCSYETPTGSRFKIQVCRPAFLTRALDRGSITRMTSLNTSPVTAEKMAKYRENLDTLIAANPELQAAAVTFNTARARYMAQSESRANK